MDGFSSSSSFRQGDNTMADQNYPSPINRDRMDTLGRIDASGMDQGGQMDEYTADGSANSMGEPSYNQMDDYGSSMRDFRGR